MRFAYPVQKIQDWITQQWVIIWGRKIKPTEVPWLMGPFGNLDVIGESFVNEFAAKEDLTVQRDQKTGGLIPSINSLNLSATDHAKLSPQVINFYENTASYNLHFP